MAHNTSTVSSHSLAHARGRSIASLFFAIFGALWLALSAFAFGHLTVAVKLALATGALTFASFAVWLLRSLPGSSGERSDQHRGEGRRFGWVNAAQGLAIFLAFQVANNLHHPNAAFPSMAIIVGLHFFALPRSMRRGSNLVTGAIMIAAGALCPLLFQGDTMVGAVALFAGVTLWCSAAWALSTAALRLRQMRQLSPAAIPAN